MTVRAREGSILRYEFRDALAVAGEDGGKDVELHSAGEQVFGDGALPRVAGDREWAEAVLVLRSEQRWVGCDERSDALFVAGADGVEELLHGAVVAGTGRNRSPDFSISQPRWLT